MPDNSAPQAAPDDDWLDTFCAECGGGDHATTSCPNLFNDIPAAAPQAGTPALFKPCGCSAVLTCSECRPAASPPVAPAMTEYDATKFTVIPINELEAIARIFLREHRPEVARTILQWLPAHEHECIEPNRGAESGGNPCVSRGYCKCWCGAKTPAMGDGCGEWEEF